MEDRQTNERQQHWPTPTAVLRGSSWGTGRPVLLLHAGGERRSVWQPVIDHLLATRPGRERWVALDQRGHGDSGGTADHIRQLGDDTSLVVGDLTADGRRCAAVGASLGGFAILAALARPATVAVVAGVVLVDVVPRPDELRVRRFLADRGLLPPGRGLVDDILGAGPELAAHLATWGGPVTLARAERSPITDRDVDRLRAELPWLEVVKVPGADHLVARTAPLALAGVIASAADRLPHQGPHPDTSGPTGQGDRPGRG